MLLEKWLLDPMTRLIGVAGLTVIAGWSAAAMLGRMDDRMVAGIAEH
jgi:hypothetical protein